MFESDSVRWRQIQTFSMSFAHEALLGGVMRFLPENTVTMLYLCAFVYMGIRCCMMCMSSVIRRRQNKYTIEKMMQSLHCIVAGFMRFLPENNTWCAFLPCICVPSDCVLYTDATTCYFAPHLLTDKGDNRVADKSMRTGNAPTSSAERRVDSIRAALAGRLLPPADSSGTAPSHKRGDGAVSDQAVASMLAAEAQRSKELSMVLGPRAFLVRLRPHTIHSSSHLLLVLSYFLVCFSLLVQLERQESGGRALDAGRKVGDLNKTFLQNTIKSVESHNRREVITLCEWDMWLCICCSCGSIYCIAARWCTICIVFCICV